MEDEFHVHGAHEHELEHKASSQGVGQGLAQQVALFTALLAAIGAIVSYLGGNTQNEALLHKNEAVLYKAQASDQWNYYQSKSTKGHLLELAMALSPVQQKDHFQSEIARYDQEKKVIKVQAEALEARSEQENHVSEAYFHPHHILALAMTFIQIAIALASVTALTQKRWLMVPAVGGALVGIGLTLWAYL